MHELTFAINDGFVTKTGRTYCLTGKGMRLCQQYMDRLSTYLEKEFPGECAETGLLGWTWDICLIYSVTNGIQSTAYPPMLNLFLNLQNMGFREEIRSEARRHKLRQSQQMN